MLESPPTRYDIFPKSMSEQPTDPPPVFGKTALDEFMEEIFAEKLLQSQKTSQQDKLDDFDYCEVETDFIKD